MDLICKPRSKSTVWLYFGLKADEKGQPLNSGEAICRLCRKIVLAKGGNTTNLRSHLRRRHRADFFESPSSTSSGAFVDAQGDFVFYQVSPERFQGRMSHSEIRKFSEMLPRGFIVIVIDQVVQ